MASSAQLKRVKGHSATSDGTKTARRSPKVHAIEADSKETRSREATASEEGDAGATKVDDQIRSNLRSSKDDWRNPPEECRQSQRQEVHRVSHKVTNRKPEDA